MISLAGLDCIRSRGRAFVKVSANCSLDLINGVQLLPIFNFLSHKVAANFNVVGALMKHWSRGNVNRFPISTTRANRVKHWVPKFSNAPSYIHGNRNGFLDERKLRVVPTLFPRLRRERGES